MYHNIKKRFDKNANSVVTSFCRESCSMHSRDNYTRFLDAGDKGRQG